MESSLAEAEQHRVLAEADAVRALTHATSPFVCFANGLTESPFASYTNGMATPGQLVRVMADVLGISKPTVVQYDRALAENGLRSKSGRGTSAAKVTSSDAANLLTAIGGSSPLGLSAKNAVEICKQFSALTSIGPAESKSKVSALGLKGLANLPDGHSFERALSALIECAAQPEFSALDDASVWVQFTGPIPGAQIIVGSWLFSHYANTRKYRRSLRSGVTERGLIHTSSLMTPGIRALGALVAGGSS